MGKIAICPECGQEFDGSRPDYLKNVNNHAEKEHGEKLVDTGRPSKKEMTEAGVEIIEVEDEKQDKTEETSQEDEPTDLIEQDLENADPKHGIFKEKPYPSEGGPDGTSPVEAKDSEVTVPSREVENAVAGKDGGQDLFGITENLDQAKKWGGRVLIGGAIATALFVSFRAYSQTSEIVDKTNNTQAESSPGERNNGADGESGQGEAVKKNPKPKPQGEVNNRNNGHKEREFTEIYRTSEDL